MYQHPIFTEKTQCQDCCKCIRHCPVNAIKTEGGSSMVIPELCIGCGKCVAVCPVGAKKVRDDLQVVKDLLSSQRKVFVSLAPSFISEFKEFSPEVIIECLLKLGFDGVSETALGAELVSWQVANEIKSGEPKIMISSACPTIVELVGKYIPKHAESITQLCSPLLAHSKYLKDELGADSAVVFIGPCISKKIEADQYPELLAAAITFQDLRSWLADERIEPLIITPSAKAHFIPKIAKEGALYPIDGGMIAGIQRKCSVTDANFMALSGVKNAQKALAEISEISLEKPLFLELLACEGGCVNGPRGSQQIATINKRYKVINFAEFAPENSRPVGGDRIDISLDRSMDSFQAPSYDEVAIRQALGMIDKFNKSEELNCGGCGYANCREFAEAMLNGKAEPQMCISHTRKLANKKTNALLQAIPSGVVIVEDNLQIIECNERFAQILGDDAENIYDIRPGMEGADLLQIAPFLAEGFKRVLSSGESIIDCDLNVGSNVYHFSMFSIEPHKVVGAILQDITNPSMHKEEVIMRSREVIKKQLETVQKIAYLLGENAAESQISLNTIIEAFSSKVGDQQGEE